MVERLSISWDASGEVCSKQGWVSAILRTAYGIVRSETMVSLFFLTGKTLVGEANAERTHADFLGPLSLGPIM